MIEFNTEELLQIKRIASCGYTPKETAFLMGVNPVEFDLLIRDEESAVSIHYFSGFLSSELKVRESIVKLAVSGSSPAQTQALKLFDETRSNLARESYKAFDKD